MIIDISSDSSMETGSDLHDYIKSTLEKSYSHFKDEITRVEVHLSDENGPRGSDSHGDKRCMIEARLRGMQPLAVTAHAENLHKAIAGASDKSTRAIENAMGKRRDRQS